MALRNGSRLHVSMQDVFPHGCHLVPESIVEAQDYDEHTGRRSPAVDKHTGQRVFQVRVMDMDPELEGRSRETVVKILADRMPVPPTRVPFEAVEFDGLVVTPYVTDKGRMAYSLRASRARPGRGRPRCCAVVGAAGVSEPRFPRAAQPERGSPGLAPRILRLPLPRLYQCHRV